jgi:hypothetical protein
MLIDDFLSEYDFVERHGVSIRAAATDIYRAANEVDFSESFLIRWLFRLRGLSSEKVTLDSLKTSRFAILGETLNRELVLGVVGRFWTLKGELKKIDAESFKRFDSAGYAKAAWNFSLSPDGDDTRLTTETRIKCTDDESRSSFRFYWTFIRPFSGLIRTEMLRLIKNKAEEPV